MKALYKLVLICLISIKANSATFNSSGVTADWSTSTSWTIVSGTDADGIPDADDNITIQLGHQINTGANRSCTIMTINGILNLGSSSFVNYGNFTISATGSLISSVSVTHSVRGNGKSFTVLGTVGSLIKYDFVYNTNITSSTNFTFLNSTSGSFSVRSGVTLNNSGNVTISNTALAGLGTWNNLSGSSLTLGRNATITNLNASAVTNTVTYNAGATAIKAPTSSYNNLTINGSKTIPANLIVSSNLTINSGTTNFQTFSLTLGGNLSGAGLISNLNTVTFNGTTAQSIAFASNLAFTNITSSNAAGVSITSGTHTISNSLTVNAGNLNVGSNLITLVSDATKTAYIANSAGTISGSMIIQRYISARFAAYTDLSSPVTSTTIDDWDDELYMAIGAAANVAGYPGGDGGAGGFYSVYEWNPTTVKWDSVLTGATLIVGKGYNNWVADDITSFPGRAIDSRGTPNMGTTSITAIYTPGHGSDSTGWNLIGNPHAAFIDWSVVVASSSNVDPVIQIYDGSGNYVNQTNPLIAPGQGFFCYVSATTTVNVPQSAKTTSTLSTFMRGTKAKDYDLKLRLSSGSNPFFHEIKINYDNTASLNYEKGSDIPFIKSPKQTAPSITFVDGTHKFVRNKMNTTSPLVVLPLEISTPIAGNYTIELEGLLSNGIYSEAYLVNNTTKEQLEIGDANAVTVYFEKGETNNNYSLILKKANVPFNLGAENVSIFSTADFINIKGSFETAQIVKVEVYNIVGQLVMNTTAELLPNDRITLSTSDLQSEVYVVKVTTSNNQQFTNKIVVTK